MTAEHPDLVTYWMLQCTVSKSLWDYLNVLPFFAELDLINSLLNDDLQGECLSNWDCNGSAICCCKHDLT